MADNWTKLRQKLWTANAPADMKTDGIPNIGPDDPRWVDHATAVIHDSGGRMGDMLRTHRGQLAHWHGEAYAAHAMKAVVGSMPVEKVEWSPPVPERTSAIMCVGCGQDRGSDSHCQSCYQQTKSLVVVDGKIID